MPNFTARPKTKAFRAIFPPGGMSSQSRKKSPAQRQSVRAILPTSPPLAAQSALLFPARHIASSPIRYQSADRDSTPSAGRPLHPSQATPAQGPRGRRWQALPPTPVVSLHTNAVLRCGSSTLLLVMQAFEEKMWSGTLLELQ